MKRLLTHTVVAVAALFSVQSRSRGQTLYIFPDNGVAPVYSFINSATKTLDMTMYEFTDTTAEQDLATLAQKGVKVRVILDQNLEKSSNQAAYTFLSAHGVSVHWADAVYAATHQKTITVDGKTSLIMTANLTSRYYPTARDFAITDTDAKDVAEIEAVFNADFNNTSVAPVRADSLIWSPNLSSAALLTFIHSAKHSLLVENEEMADPNIVTALAARARAGVAVTVIMTNYNSEYAAEFNTLTKAGVKVYTYPYANTGLYIHAKVMSADFGYPGPNAYLGSINFSTYSETKNRELGQTTQNATVLKTLNATLLSDARGGTLWNATSAPSKRSSRNQSPQQRHHRPPGPVS